MPGQTQLPLSASARQSNMFGVDDWIVTVATKEFASLQVLFCTTAR